MFERRISNEALGNFFVHHVWQEVEEHIRMEKHSSTLLLEGQEGRPAATKTVRSIYLEQPALLLPWYAGRDITSYLTVALYHIYRVV